MRKIMHMILVMTLLVMPAVARAVPCNMDMSKDMAMHHVMQSKQDCPHHKQQPPKSCDGKMSVADCMGGGMITSADAVSLKTLKSNASVIAILVFHPLEPVALLGTSPRAPPEIHNISIPQTSLILTTQRFRI
jgi:hypothetical protein